MAKCIKHGLFPAVCLALGTAKQVPVRVDKRIDRLGAVVVAKLRHHVFQTPEDEDKGLDPGWSEGR